jgi:hypothetical protein
VPTESAAASDLGTFGTRAWVRGILTDAAGPKHFGATKLAGGDMAIWVADNVTSKKVKEDELDAVIEFLASFSNHKENGSIDKEKVAAGARFFALGSDATTGTCYDCHAMKIDPDPEELFKEPSAQIATGAPDLTGYGSREWIAGVHRVFEIGGAQAAARIGGANDQQRPTVPLELRRTLHERRSPYFDSRARRCLTKAN